MQTSAATRQTARPRDRWFRALAALAAVGLSVTFAFAQAGAAREDLVAKLAGKKVRVDASTKQVRAITADEAREFIAAVTNATESAQVAKVSAPVGSIARLDDHAGHIIVTRPNQDGSVSLRCVGSADEAVAFLVEEGLPLQ
jgi:hypothetical protein